MFVKKLVAISFIFCISFYNVYSQSANEAIRYSRYDIYGTARGLGVAGAFGAIGADFTSVISNPAGLGLFRSSEFMISPIVESAASNSDYIHVNTKAQATAFRMNNIGLVFSKLFEDDEGNRYKGDWIAVNFAFGLNRLVSFNEERRYQSSGTFNSILFSYNEEVQGLTPEEITGGFVSFAAQSAFEARLITESPNEPTTYNYVTDSVPVNQDIRLNSTGGIQELSFSLAANYDNRLFFGGTIGVPILRYTENLIISESDAFDISSVFNSFEQTQFLKTSGIGVNFKLGFIYRLGKLVRFGMSFHTPTYYSMKDKYQTDLSTDITGSIEPIPGEFKYKLISPLRLNTSFGVFLKKFGFFSVEYERVNYGNARYRTKDFPAFEDNVNQDVIDFYGTGRNVKLGLELAWKILRIRGGYAFFNIPFKDKTTFEKANEQQHNYTAGIGVRLKRLFFDFAYVRSVSNSVGLFVNQEVAASIAKRDNYILTMGVKF